MGFFNNVGADLSRAEYNKIVYEKLTNRLYELHCDAYSKSIQSLRGAYFQVLYYENINQERLSIRERFSQGDQFSEYYPYVKDEDVYAIGEQLGKISTDVKYEIEVLLHHIFEGIADRDNQFIMQVRYRDASRLETIDVKPRIK